MIVSLFRQHVKEKFLNPGKEPPPPPEMFRLEHIAGPLMLLVGGLTLSLLAFVHEVCTAMK